VISEQRTAEKLIATRDSNIPQGPFNTFAGFIKETRGAVMIDIHGREIIDFVGGIGVNNVGHCHPKVVAAIKDQAEKYIHACFHVVGRSRYAAEKKLK